MRESPFQMTPSQSKMKTSVFSMSLEPTEPPFILTGLVVLGAKVLAPARRANMLDGLPAERPVLLSIDDDALPRA